MKLNRFNHVWLIFLITFLLASCSQEKAEKKTIVQNEETRWPELTTCMRLIQPEEPYSDIESIRAKADQGDPEANAILVQEYYRGDLTSHNPEAAIAQLPKALKLGHPLAFYFQAYHMEKGLDGKPRDAEGSEDAWRNALQSLKAIEKPSGHVLDALCMIYSSGRATGGQADFEKAWSYCKKACQFDLPQPWVRRGWFLENGVGGAEKSADQAFQAYLTASRLGSSLANHHLARCYLEGVGGEKNRQMALGYLARAAKKGVPNANHDLEGILEKGFNFLSSGETRVLVEDSRKVAYRFGVGDKVTVRIPDDPGSTWTGIVVDRRKNKYKVKIASVSPTQPASALAPCPCTGQEILTADKTSQVTYAWIPESCVKDDPSRNTVSNLQDETPKQGNPG